MADRMEREIEEILSKLDVDAPKPERTPISIMTKRTKPRSGMAVRGRNRVPAVSPAVLLIVGAVIMIAGLVLSNVWGPLIWMAFAGVVVFLAAFALSFRRTPPSSATQAARGHYWRDRYIEYEPGGSDLMTRFKRRFRR